MFNEKAQESAPFELLVAVIVMGFVILFGMNALQSLSKEQCSKELDNLMATVKNKFENVVKLGQPQTMSVGFPSCYKDSTMYLRAVPNEHLCSSYCLKQTSVCMLLQFTSEQQTRLSCVDVTTFINFPLEGFDCASRDGYTLVEPILPFGSIQKGYYLMSNITPSGSSTRTICMYRQGAAV